LLSSDDGVSKQTLDQQQALVNQLQATVKATRRPSTMPPCNSYTQIRSPVTGRVGIRNVDPGNLVRTSDTQGLFSVTQIDPIAVEFSLPQQMLPTLQSLLGATPAHEAYGPDGERSLLGEGHLTLIDNQIGQHRHGAGQGRVRQQGRPPVAGPTGDRDACTAWTRTPWWCRPRGATRHRRALRLPPGRRQGRSVPVQVLYQDSTLNIISRGEAGDCWCSMASRGSNRAHGSSHPTPPPRKWRTAGASHEHPQRRFGLVHRPPGRHPAADLRPGAAGAIAFPRLPVAPLPEADFPTIQVTAQLPGASPETMASSVATPLEVQFSAIPGMTQMTSSSALGSTNLTLQFTLDKNIDTAAQEVQAAINTAAGACPRTCPARRPGARSTRPTARC
jgi:hypothetical protein